MKFFWKIYFSFTTLFLVSFGLFGIWMIQMNFEKSYQKVLEEGEQVWMYVREKNKEIVELVILVGGKEEFMLMSFCGVIDLKKISRLAKAVNVEGMEYLGKVKK